MKRNLRAIALATAAAAMLAFGLVLAGCSTSGNDASQDSAPSTDTNTPELSGTMKVVATADYYTPLFDKFTQETGVQVEALSMSSGEVLSKLRAEGGTPSADLWFGGGVDAFMSAKDDGLLEQVSFDAASDLDSTYKDSEGYWFSKGLTIVGFLVNDDLMGELGLETPTSWADLTDPSYAGEIVMSNPAVSGTNYAAVNALLQNMGEDEGWSYFEQLNSNIAYYAKRGADPKNKVSNNEYAIGVTYIDGTIEQLTEDQNLTIVYPSDGVPWMPDGVAAFANADNTEAATYFIEWLFSNDENLQLLAELDQKNSVKLIKPSLEGIELGYDTSILLPEDLSLFGEQRDAMLERFEALMGDKASE